MKKLKIDLADLMIAFENSGWEMNHYLYRLFRENRELLVGLIQ